MLKECADGREEAELTAFFLRYIISELSQKIVIEKKNYKRYRIYHERHEYEISKRNTLDQYFTIKEREFRYDKIEGNLTKIPNKKYTKYRNIPIIYQKFQIKSSNIIKNWLSRNWFSTQDNEYPIIWHIDPSPFFILIHNTIISVIFQLSFHIFSSFTSSIHTECLEIWFIQKKMKAVRSLCCLFTFKAIHPQLMYTFIFSSCHLSSFSSSNIYFSMRNVRRRKRVRSISR